MFLKYDKPFLRSFKVTGIISFVFFHTHSSYSPMNKVWIVNIGVTHEELHKEKLPLKRPHWHWPPFVWLMHHKQVLLKSVAFGPKSLRMLGIGHSQVISSVFLSLSDAILVDERISVFGAQSLGSLFLEREICTMSCLRLNGGRGELWLGTTMTWQKQASSWMRWIEFVALLQLSTYTYRHASWVFIHVFVHFILCSTFSSCSVCATSLKRRWKEGGGLVQVLISFKPSAILVCEMILRALVSESVAQNLTTVVVLTHSSHYRQPMGSVCTHDLCD